MKFKASFLDNTNEVDIINAEIAVPLKYLSNFWKILEILLINFHQLVLFLKGTVQQLLQ